MVRTTLKVVFQGDHRIAYKLEFYAQIAKKCQQLMSEGKEVVIVGDLNTAHTPLDTHNPDVCATMTVNTTSTGPLTPPSQHAMTFITLTNYQHDEHLSFYDHITITSLHHHHHHHYHHTNTSPSLSYHHRTHSITLHSCLYWTPSQLF